MSLKGLVREMLRAQPEDINAFGLSTLLICKPRQPSRRVQLVSRMRSSRNFLKNLFIQADADGSGALSLQEFKTVLVNVDLGLSDKEMKRIMVQKLTSTAMVKYRMTNSFH